MNKAFVLNDCNFGGICKMNICKILFRHTTKNFEINVSINVNKLRVENATTKWELHSKLNIIKMIDEILDTYDQRKRSRT